LWRAWTWRRPSCSSWWGAGGGLGLAGAGWVAISQRGALEHPRASRRLPASGCLPDHPPNELTPLPCLPPPRPGAPREQELVWGGSDLLSVLRLLVLLSATQGGVPRRHWDPLRAEIVSAYGHQHLLTLNNLERAGGLGGLQV
jgi:hypothetical protein